MHGHRAGQKRFMGSRGTDPGVNNVPERIHKHIKNDIHPFSPIFTISLPPGIWIRTVVSGNT